MEQDPWHLGIGPRTEMSPAYALCRAGKNNRGKLDETAILRCRRSGCRGHARHAMKKSEKTRMHPSVKHLFLRIPTNAKNIEEFCRAHNRSEERRVGKECRSRWS